MHEILINSLLYLKGNQNKVILIQFRKYIYIISKKKENFVVVLVLLIHSLSNRVDIKVKQVGENVGRFKFVC
jgi:hypothetical protein